MSDSGDPMSNGAAVIAATLDSWDGAWHLERELFGTVDPQLIADAVDAFCRERLGAGVARYEFFSSGVGSVHGVRLRDGRRAVVKVNRASVDRLHLNAVARLQRHLGDAGFPSPRPLVDATELGCGVAIVEELLDGAWADPHDPGVRCEMAATLARLVALCRPLVGLPGLGRFRDWQRRLWEQPHDRRFDFPGTTGDSRWIDHLARLADERLDELAAGPDVIGHGDYKAEHVRFAGGRACAVYDWDSLAVGPEPVIVGSAAHVFTADWSRENHRCVPTLAESLAFIDDYETARGAQFTPGERQTARAAMVALIAYGARCEQSDRLTDFGTRPPRRAPATVPPGGFLANLATHGAQLLGVGADSPAVAASPRPDRPST
jgi:aminoglycoside phosphotransferase (APT) family kinase protein